MVQLADQQQYLGFKARQQYDMYHLLEIWQRLKRTKRNFHRFSEKCLLIKLEMAKREGISQEGNNRRDYSEL